MVLPLIAGGLGMYALSQRDKARKAAAQEALDNAPSLGGDFLKAFITATPGLSIVTAPFRQDAREARQDQSGFWPELGISEGMKANLPSKNFIPALAKTVAGPGLSTLVGLGSEESQEARQDQSGFFPEFGLSEAFQAGLPWHDYAKNKQQLQAVVDGKSKKVGSNLPWNDPRNMTVHAMEMRGDL
tara:strand:+ start:415 stop:972 length:558 start_codon:yes stop_codon:yes gene_type:complete